VHALPRILRPLRDAAAGEAKRYACQCAKPLALLVFSVDCENGIKTVIEKRFKLETTTGSYEPSLAGPISRCASAGALRPVALWRKSAGNGPTRFVSGLIRAVRSNSMAGFLP